MSKTIAEVVRTQLGFGGNVIVITGHPEHFGFTHDRVTVIDADRQTQELPLNSRYVFFTRFVSHMTFTAYLKQINQMHLLYHRAEQPEIRKILKEALEIKPEDAPKVIKNEHIKGKLKPLIPHIDWSKTNIENAKHLMTKLHDLNINSTEGSLAQFVATERKKRHGTAIPKSIRPKLDVTVDMLDNIIKDIGDMRDFLIETVEENRILKTKVEKFKKLMDE